ncbi:hypothetical protein K488DRAFT_82968 [Vararia minispora EC-137]|uniref:Uncharacterized protein n=1 Tax=Vararia minispora EC-137 TaxID=1314806 RepID=A0ACB8QVG1_9AGAM|nr:hypothetical protein K488DRAFT_82968 [Vararia minispora EC-137]
MASSVAESESDEEDPFHFDRARGVARAPLRPVNMPAQSLTELAARPSRRTTQLARSLMHRASIVPLPAPSSSSNRGSARFSFMRTRADDEDVFVQEIEDERGHRWSLRVPASGLPKDMLHMLEELETLARELTEVIPRIVITQSTQSLDKCRPGQNAVVEEGKPSRPDAPNRPSSPVPNESVAILRSMNEGPATASYVSRSSLDESAFRGTQGRSGGITPTDLQTKTLDSVDTPGESIKRADTSLCSSVGTQSNQPDLPPIVQASLPVDPSLHCIFLPNVRASSHWTTRNSLTFIQLTPEILKGNAALPGIDLAVRDQAKPALAPTARQRAATFGDASPRGNAFFAALDADAASSALSKAHRTGSSALRLKTSSLYIKQPSDAHCPSSSRRFTSTSEVAPMFTHRTPPKRAVSASSLVSPSPPPPPVVEPKQRTRGKSLLQLRPKSSKSNILAIQPAPASAPPQVPIYKWSHLAPEPMPAVASSPPPHKSTLKDFFRRPPSRSASEPPPYHPPALTAEPMKARPISEGVGMHASPFELDAWPPPVPATGERREQQQHKQVRRIPSARDLFRKKK